MQKSSGSHLDGRSSATRKYSLLMKIFAHQNDDRRHEMLSDILRINRELGVTVLYVTNDPEEALSLDSRIIFMRDGKIEEDRKA